MMNENTLTPDMVLNDPTFHNLQPGEQSRVLDEIDPEFVSLPAAERFKVIKALQAMRASVSDVQQAAQQSTSNMPLGSISRIGQSFTDVGQDWKNRASNIGAEISTMSGDQPTIERIAGLEGLNIPGQIIGGVWDVPYEFIIAPILEEADRQASIERRSAEQFVKKVFEQPDVVAQAFPEFAKYRDFFDTKMGEIAKSALIKGAEGLESLQRDNPRVFRTLDSIMNLSGAAPIISAMRKGAGLAMKEASNILFDIKKGLSDSPTALSKASDIIRTEGKKVIELGGRNTTPTSRALAETKMEGAFTDIIDNAYKGVVKLPTDKKTALADTAKAIEDIKRSYQPQIENAIKTVDNSGIEFSPQRAIDLIEEWKNKPATKNVSIAKSHLKMADDQIELLKNVKTFADAQQTFLGMEGKLSGNFYREKSFEHAYQEEILGRAAQGLREAFKDGISESGNAVLAKYGNLLSIEDQINSKIFTALKKGGVSDDLTYAAMTGAKAILTGNLTGNIAYASARLENAIKTLSKNDGKILAEMFKNASSALEISQPYRSQFGLAAQEVSKMFQSRGIPGPTADQIGKELVLAIRPRSTYSAEFAAQNRRAATPSLPPGSPELLQLPAPITVPPRILPDGSPLRDNPVLQNINKFLIQNGKPILNAEESARIFEAFPKTREMVIAERRAQARSVPKTQKDLNSYNDQTTKQVEKARKEMQKRKYRK